MSTLIASVFIIHLAWSYQSAGDSLPQSITSTSCEEQLMPEPHEALSMVQLKVQALGNRQQPNLRSANPIAWVHIPKCGSSFINLILHHEGICPGTPDDVILGGKSVEQRKNSPFIQKANLSKDDSLPLSFNHPVWPELCVFCEFVEPDELIEYCAGGLSNEYPAPLPEDPPFFRLGGHWGINEAYQQVQGHFVTFLRQPEQRLLSGWTSRWGLQIHKTEQETKPHEAYHWSALQYAQHNAGCQVKMLTRAGKPCDLTDSDQPSWDEVELAKKRLREGFAFVGLTDEWSLSVCMFHKMFGGPCKQTDFGNVRPSTKYSDRMKKTPTTNQYDTSVLNGFVDVHDRALYSEATAIFEEHMKEYNVNEAACEACFANA